MWRDLSKLFRELMEVSSPDVGAYRPDRHYMRGPGPKWRAKYGGLVNKTQQSPASARSILSDVAEHRA